MSISQLPDGRWSVRVEMGRTVLGKRDRRAKICATLKEAQAFERECLRQRDRNGGRSDRERFDRFVLDVWLPSKEPICTYTTLAAYKSHLRVHLLPRLGSMNIADISRLDVQAVITAAGTYKAARNAHATLKNVLNLAVELEVVPRNVALGSYRLPRKIQGPECSGSPAWLTSFDEHVAVIEAARGDVVFPMLVLGLCFGLRKGEILGLDWSDVDFDRREIRIRQTYVREDGGPRLLPPKTPASERTIPMSDYAARLLTEIRAAGGAVRLNGAVCPGKRTPRMNPSRASVYLRDFCDAHPELPRVTLLTLRHSFATSCIRAGLNVASVSRWLGHESVSTTLNRYVRPLQQDLRGDVAERLDILYSAAL